FRISIVHSDAGNATAYVAGSSPYTFYAYEQIEALLRNRKIAFLNSHAINAQKIDYISPETTSVCIVPLRNGTFFGFILLESNTNNTLSEGKESILLHISDYISDWLSKKEWETDNTESEKTKEIAESDGLDFISRIKKIKCVDADAALERMGGLEDAYEKTISILVRLLPDTICKMDKYVEEGSLKEFRIEVHGVKGVLRNIGATEPGNDAANLENAANEENQALCDELYPPFKSMLEALGEQLIDALEVSERPKEKVGAEKLKAAIEAATIAVEGFDAMGALDALSPLRDVSFTDETDELIRQTIFALEEFNCGSAAEYIQKISQFI
ncbi:MAG: Hpt domain-containing protein, partial [Clostridiales bacterium]|nr:Hpt domain-containing protein [Clostridiales bacterium]